MMTAMFLRLAVGAIAAFMLFGCASGKDAAPLRSSVAQGDLASWAIRATEARSAKHAVDEMVAAQLKLACDQKKLEAGTCDLLALQAKYAVQSKRIEAVGEKWVIHAIKNPDQPVGGGFDFNELLDMAIKGAAASQTGGASNLFLK